MVESVETHENTQEATPERNARGFAAGEYLRRTGEVLKSTVSEASKLQADTRSALWSVFEDFRTDLNGELGSLMKTVKARAEALRRQLPFVGGEKEEAAPAANPTPSDEAPAPSQSA